MKKTIQDLNALYQEADGTDSELFAEQRSNILLVSGNHYARKMREILSRQATNLSREQKVRIVRNHLKKITSTYQNNILSFAPDVCIKAKNESEIQDQKIAEWAQAIWTDWKECTDFASKKGKLVADFIDIGEAIVKVFFDPNAGKFLGYEPVLDEMGMPITDEEGKPKVKARFQGEIICERVLGMNLLRDPEAKEWDEVRWVCVRKMVDTKHLKAMVAHDDNLVKAVTESSQTTYQVFDGQNTQYTTAAKSKTLTREYFFKPCNDYPNGYFYITTEEGILFEGELPNAEWPFAYVSFDEFPTSCRGYSIIKQLRPVQAEINRAASAIVQTQITLGMDKLILRNGASMEAGGEAHGVKAIQVIGQDPTILAGRNGEQFVGYLSDCISELYAIAQLPEDDDKVENGQVDPYGALFRTIRQKKRISTWGSKYARFLKTICQKVLDASQVYYTPDRLIQVVGRSEQVNLAEWQNVQSLKYAIVTEESNEDVESKMGRQLSLNHILQYGGANLSSEDLGKVLRLMPYVNNEKMFDEFTLNYDVATNIILRLDRGEYVPAKPNQDHIYIIKRLDHRMLSPDFDFLPPEVQQIYAQVKTEHDQMEAQRQIQIQQMKDGYIPTSTNLVACDFYVSDPKQPDKMPKRARLPFESLIWLAQRLEAQSQAQGQLYSMSEGNVANVAEQMGAMGMQGQQIPDATQINQGALSQTLPSQGTQEM